MYTTGVYLYMRMGDSLFKLFKKAKALSSLGNMV